VSFTAINLCVASQGVYIIVLYFVTDSVQKLLDTPSYVPSFVQKQVYNMPRYARASFQLRNGVTDFRDIWYEHYITGDHTNFLPLFNFLQSVITTCRADECVRRKRH
jgi:hypothetical protein